MCALHTEKAHTKLKQEDRSQGNNKFEFLVLESEIIHHL